MRKSLGLLFTALVILVLYSFQTTNYRELIIAQFKRAQGDYEGFLESTDFKDDITKETSSAICTSKFDGNIWSYDVTYEIPNGEIFSGTGTCEVNKDGTKIDNNGVIWDVLDVLIQGDTASVIMQVQGKDNRKKATLRQILTITSSTFTITEEVKYNDSQRFFVRNKHIFRRKKTTKK